MIPGKAVRRRETEGGCDEIDALIPLLCQDEPTGRRWVRSDGLSRNSNSLCTKSRISSHSFGNVRGFATLLHSDPPEVEKIVAHQSRILANLRQADDRY
jgi:hypothetical protein